MSKTNYRNVYKSDFLGSVDIEEMIDKGTRLVFTITEVKQLMNTTVAGKKGDFNIAYFKEGIKPLVLNSTNAKTLKNLSGGSIYVENWKNVPVELYIDPSVKMKGEVVGGVRIKPTSPVIEKPVFSEANFEKAKAANASVDKIKAVYSLSPQMEAKYLEYAAN
jgi:hypothetical protein